MKTNNHILKTNRNKLMKRNKPNTRNHTSKHTSACDELLFGSDAISAQLRSLVRGVTITVLPNV